MFYFLDFILLHLNMLNVASAKYVNVMCMMICAKLLIEIETLILHNGWNIKKQQRYLRLFF